MSADRLQPITEEQLVEWEGLVVEAAKATMYGDLGSWKVVEPERVGEEMQVVDTGNDVVATIGSTSEWMCDGEAGCGDECYGRREEDRKLGKFIAASFDAVPMLVAEVRHLRLIVEGSFLLARNEELHQRVQELTRQLHRNHVVNAADCELCGDDVA